MSSSISLPSEKAPKCFQCGSPLIEVSKVTTHPEGSLFPQTTSVYRCSDEKCQAEKDKETAKRLKLQEEKELAEKKRAEDRQKAHEAKVKITLDKEV